MYECNIFVYTKKKRILFNLTTAAAGNIGNSDKAGNNYLHSRGKISVDRSTSSCVYEIKW